MRVEDLPSEGPPRSSFGLRKPPLWARFALALGVAAILILALILFVNHETNGVPSEAPVNSPNAIVEQNREDQIIVRDQQAPHIASVKPGTAPAVGLKTAIVAYLASQIKTGKMAGPLSAAASSCAPAAGGTSGRVTLRCSIVTANVTYPFYGVVEPANGQITFCQRVPPPVYGMDDVPLSRRCT